MSRCIVCAFVRESKSCRVGIDYEKIYKDSQIGDTGQLYLIETGRNVKLLHESLSLMCVGRVIP
jgi:hypothetical protein